MSSCRKTASWYACCLLGLTFPTACDPPDVERAEGPSADAPLLVARVETGLLPAVLLQGEEPPFWPIEERMEHYQVPAVGVAVLHGGEVAWAKAYGVADLGTGAPATPGTLFQAASISKPVAALAALSLVEEGLLDLDAPVNDFLTSWRLADNEFTADSVVTLRHLLTHSAGLTVWGIPGYRKDQPFSDVQELPTNVQVLDGDGNTDPVRVYKVPGTSWQFSCGGYTVMEQMVEDVTGHPFQEVARERVLRPAGMVRSTYEQPLPSDRWEEAARGYRSDGSEVEGEWHTYPEQAAAGLWTTPTDLATLSVHLLGILDGSETDGVVSRSTLEQMLTPNHDGAEEFSSWGLGFGLSEPGAERTFGHGGSNEGFRATWTVNRDQGTGFAIMTNGDRGSSLATEIGRAIAAVYEWRGWLPETRARIRPDSAAFAALSGEYGIEGLEDFVITFRPGPDATLAIDVPGQGTMTFHAASDDEWFETADGDVMVIERDDDGNVIRAVVEGQTVLIPR